MKVSLNITMIEFSLDLLKFLKEVLDKGKNTNINISIIDATLIMLLLLIIGYCVGFLGRKKKGIEKFFT